MVLKFWKVSPYKDATTCPALTTFTYNNGRGTWPKKETFHGQPVGMN